MPRPRKHRSCRHFNGDRVFKPRSIPMSDLQRVRLDLDELEAMRLCDVEHCDQEEAGRRMGISRGTIHRLVKSGRAKVLHSILNSHALIIENEKPVKQT